MGQELTPIFETGLCKQLGITFTPDVHAFFVAWQHAEGATAAFNPFDTELRLPGSTNYNSAGVQNYRSLGQGIQATASTLKNGYYPLILAALKDGSNAYQMANALAQSPWGTGIGAYDYLEATHYVPSGEGGDEVTPEQMNTIINTVTKNITDWLVKEFNPNPQGELYGRIIQAVKAAK